MSTRWWLSFCDPARPAGQQFLGACIVEAVDEITAVKVAHALGINPGGEVAFKGLVNEKMDQLSFDFRAYYDRFIPRGEAHTLSHALPVGPGGLDEYFAEPICTCSQEGDYCPEHPNCACGCARHAHRGGPCIAGKMTCHGCEGYRPAEHKRFQELDDDAVEHASIENLRLAYKNLRAHHIEEATALFLLPAPVQVTMGARIPSIRPDPSQRILG